MSLRRGYGEAKVCLSSGILQNAPQTVAGLSLWVFSCHCWICGLCCTDYKCFDESTSDQKSGREVIGHYTSSSIPEVLEPTGEIGTAKHTKNPKGYFPE